MVKATIEKGWHIYMDATYFENTVVFQQKVKLMKDQPVINGSVSYMACSFWNVINCDKVAKACISILSAAYCHNTDVYRSVPNGFYQCFFAKYLTIN